MPHTLRTKEESVAEDEVSVVIQVDIRMTDRRKLTTGLPVENTGEVIIRCCIQGMEDVDGNGRPPQPRIYTLPRILYRQGTAVPCILRQRVFESSLKSLNVNRDYILRYPTTFESVIMQKRINR
ncbi:hypothetical protein TNCV_147071 [Trichonephila clavipes]|nr:hypothetical protein TNCV_147071 [Trichonephila clavipes]